ncbi:MAG: hypothetical protein [Wigfec virus K19_170]|nr:MAG: hypothetical protein [Wigfec virus K19_170]
MAEQGSKLMDQSQIDLIQTIFLAALSFFASRKKKEI